jgi:hypothetical protein
MTKKQAINLFNDEWEFTLKRCPNWKNDLCAKRQSFVEFVDSLVRDGQVTERRAFMWENPF